MTYLELVRAVLAEGETGDPDSLVPRAGGGAIAALRGYDALVASHVRSAWIRVQTSKPSWLFRRHEFRARLAPGVSVYVAGEDPDDPSVLRDIGGTPSVPSVSQWIVDPDRGSPAGVPGWRLSDDGLQGTSPIQSALLVQEGWESFWADNVARTAARQESRPTRFAIDPHNRIHLTPIPDTGGPYTIFGHYQSAVQRLTDDDDVPLGLPPEYLDVVVYRATMLLHAHDEAAQAYQLAQAAYSDLYAALVRDQTPAVTVQPQSFATRGGGGLLPVF